MMIKKHVKFSYTPTNPVFVVNTGSRNILNSFTVTK